MKGYLKKLLKINVCKIIIPLSIILFSQPIFAQSALGCDGNRYLKDVFTDTIQTRNIQFGKNGIDLFMDVIEPKGDNLAQRPLLVLAFGGGFVQGKRTEQYMLDMCYLFAKKGFVCATVDYRLYNILNGFPDSLKISPTVIGAIHDMKAAIRYFRKDAADKNTFRIDSTNIISGGASAGAITAMHVAHLDSTDVIPTWLNDIIKNLGGLEGNSGNAGYSSSVKGVLSLSGGLYQKEFIDKNDVPFIAYHGSADNVVPFGFGKNVYGFNTDGDSSCFAYAKSLGIKANLVMVPGGGHQDIYDFKGKYASNLTDFLNQSSLFLKQLVCGEPITSPVQTLDNALIQVYPNPSQDVMTIRFDENTEGYQVRILDALGRQVLNSGSITGEQFNIYKRDIGKGFFIAHISNVRNNKFLIKKIVFE